MERLAAPKLSDHDSNNLKLPFTTIITTIAAAVRCSIKKVDQILIDARSRTDTHKLCLSMA